MYPRGTYYAKVLNDIQEWFDNGKQPQVSELAPFRKYSLSQKVTAKQQKAKEEVFNEYYTEKLIIEEKKAQEQKSRAKARNQGNNQAKQIFGYSKYLYALHYKRHPCGCLFAIVFIQFRFRVGR